MAPGSPRKSIDKPSTARKRKPESPLSDRDTKKVCCSPSTSENPNKRNGSTTLSDEKVAKKQCLDREDGSGGLEDKKESLVVAAPGARHIPVELVSFFRSCCIEDIVRFSSVSRDWNDVMTQIPIPKLSPCLLLAEGEDHKRGICSVFGSGRPIRFYIKDFYESRCWGSIDGWIFVLGLHNLQIGLVNPLSGTRIHLPSMAHFPRYHHSTHYVSSYVYKIASDSCGAGKPKLVVAIYSGSRTIAFCSPGGISWTEIDTSFRGGFEDVAFYPKSNCFYAIRSDGTLFRFQPGVDQSRATEVAPPPEFISPKQGKFYLVVMYSSLYLILRKLSPFLSVNEHPSKFHYQTNGFDIFRFDMLLESWEAVFDFRDAIFLGSNTTFSVSTSDYDSTNPSDVKGNVIYFTDDCEENFSRTEYTDMGSFDFEKKMNSALNLQLEGRDMYSPFSPATYFAPSVSLCHIVDKNAEVQGSMVRST